MANGCCKCKLKYDQDDDCCDFYTYKTMRKASCGASGEGGAISMGKPWNHSINRKTISDLIQKKMNKLMYLIEFLQEYQDIN